MLLLPFNFFAKVVMLPSVYVTSCSQFASFLAGLPCCLPNASAFRRFPYKMETFPVRHSFPPCKKSLL